MAVWTASELKRLADAHVARCLETRNRPKVSELARNAELPIYAFSKVFLRLVGERPRDYLERGLIERAKRLLLTTEESIEEIADACCYQDPATFYRAFRRVVGMTPKQFRKRYGVVASRIPSSGKGGKKHH